MVNVYTFVLLVKILKYKVETETWGLNGFYKNSIRVKELNTDSKTSN